MAHIDTSRSHAPVFSFRDVIDEIVTEFRAWNARRRTVAELSKLSRRQLADIGLDGVDLEEVARRMAR
jgi:uncharacterized protein YjiS (DUF1127 family)